MAVLLQWARAELGSTSGWRAIARPKQLVPLEHDRTFVSGGRGSGKTRTGAETLAEWAWASPGSEWCVVAPSYGHARSVCVESPSGLLAALGGRREDKVARWNASQGELRLTNGSLVVVDGADDGAPGIQGHNLSGGWCDEVGLWSHLRWRVAWEESIGFAVRRGGGRMIVTGTPKQGHPLVARLMADPSWVKVRMTTSENIANLSADVVAELERRHAGTRLGRQELEGIWLEDIPGALWALALIDAHRRPVPTLSTGEVDLSRIVVGVDPAVTSGLEADETGIVAAGLGPDRHVWVIEDRSCRGTPEGWAREVASLVTDLRADAVVAEANQGGDLVEHVLRSVAPHLPVKLVRASRGKRTRAEPVSALYERGLVHHPWPLPVLEDQMTRFTPDSGGHDDRVDALVWALTELVGEGRPTARSVGPEGPADPWGSWR